MNAGATPKFTASASESISSPIFDVALSIRAMRPSSASRIAATARNAIASVGRLSSANFTADSPRQMAATVIALGSIRRLTTGALTRGFIRQLRQDVSPPTARWPGSDEHVGALRQVGVQPRPEPDEAVGVADRHLVAGLDVADDPPGEQPGDLHGDHLGAFGRADQHAVAFVVLRWPRRARRI